MTIDRQGGRGRYFRVIYPVLRRHVQDILRRFPGPDLRCARDRKSELDDC